MKIVKHTAVFSSLEGQQPRYSTKSRQLTAGHHRVVHFGPLLRDASKDHEVARLLHDGEQLKDEEDTPRAERRDDEGLREARDEYENVGELQVDRLGLRLRVPHEAHHLQKSTYRRVRVG